MSRPARDTASEPTKPQPTITMVTGDVELVPPRGCSASVLLKLVDQDDGHRYFSWWLVVERSAADAQPVPYKHNGGDTFRIDLPEGMPLSATRLQPYLTAFWHEQQPPGADDPPIIKG